MRIAWFLGWLAGVMACSAHASPIPEWQTSFGAVGRPPLSYNEEPALVRDPVTGAFYLHNFGLPGIVSMTVRVDASGAVAWANSTARDSSPSTRRVTPLVDGSVVVVTQELQRLGADGTRLWSIPWPSSLDSPLVFEAGADLLVIDVTAKAPVTRVDRDTGRLLEWSGLGTLGAGCRWIDGAGHAGAVYFSASGDPGCDALVKVRANPLRIEWVLPGFGAETFAMVADADGAYVGRWVAGERRVEKRLSDGSLAWSVPAPMAESVALPNRPWLLLDADGHLLVRGTRVVDKFDRSTGALRWRHVVDAGLVVDVATSSDAIVIARTDGDETGISANPGHVSRLRRSDGVEVWHASLPPSESGGARVTGVAVGDAGILATGTTCAEGAQPFQCRLVMWPLALDGTVAPARMPMFALPSSTGHAVPAGGGTTVAAALEWGPGGQQLRVRRVNNADGGIIWESVRPAALPGMPGHFAGTIRVAVSKRRDGAVAVLYFGSAGDIPPRSDAVVATFDGRTGQHRWQRSLVDRDAGYTDVAAYALGLDSAENVLVTLHEARRESFPTPYVPNRRQLRKYAAASGDVLFAIDFQGPLGGQVNYYAVPFADVVGDDVLTGEPPGSNPTYALTRISGADGSVMWSDSTGSLALTRLHDANRSYAATSGSTASIQAHGLSGGSLAWAMSYSDPADRSYSLHALHAGSDGAIYAGGWRAVPRPGSASVTDRHGMVMRVDAGSGALTWASRFDENPAWSNNDYLQPVFDRDDIVYA